MAPNWPPDDQRQATESSNSIPSGSHEEQTASDENHQESLTLSSQASPTPAGPQLVTNPPAPPSSIAIWIDRLGLVIRVAFYIELGMLLVVLPWTRLWTDNSLVANLPAVKEFMQGNFIRGLISGIGFVDIWIGVWEAVRYREGNRG